MSMIEFHDVSYIYSKDTPFERRAIDHINLRIEEGEFVGLIGHTGSGKSTLVQHLNGLMEPSEGKVLVDGVDLFSLPARERKQARFQVGLVFQYPEYQLFEETVEGDIAFGPKNMGLSGEEIARRVEEAMELVGLDPEMKKRSPFELSGGEKRRVAIAGVMAMRPKVLVLDEPTAGLDPAGRDEILGNIETYHQRYQATIVLVSHSMEDIARYAKSIIVMEDATLYMKGSVDEVFGHSEKLLEMGLDIPEITRVFLELSHRGYAVDTSVYTIAAAKEQILALTGRKGDNAHA